MTSYRVYLLTMQDGIAEAEDVSCADDHRALECAERMMKGFFRAEVWSGDRRVSGVDGVALD